MRKLKITMQIQKKFFSCDYSFHYFCTYQNVDVKPAWLKVSATCSCKPSPCPLPMGRGGRRAFYHLRGVSPFSISSFALASVLFHISNVSRPMRAASFVTSDRLTS